MDWLSFTSVVGHTSVCYQLITLKLKAIPVSHSNIQRQFLFISKK